MSAADAVPDDPNIKNGESTENTTDGNLNSDKASPAKKTRKRPRTEYPVSMWYEACQKFMDDPKKYNSSQVQFLRSQDSGVLDENHKVSFGKRLKAFKDGNLPQDSGGSIKRVRKGKYLDVEQCLIAFIETRTKFSKGKTAVTWPFLLELSKRFAVALGYKDFRASPGWLSNVLKRNKTSLYDDINEDDAMVYLESIKKYCRKNRFGREIQTQCDHLYKLIKKEVKRDEDAPLEQGGGHENERRASQEQKFRFPPPVAGLQVPFWPHASF
jgi:hypothetical protein